ncbi:hypothetical protein [Spiroplasma endosymbiont of Acasis viretata]
MLWNCCIKFFSNNFDNEYQYLQPMDSNYMYYPTSNGGCHLPLAT